MCDVQLVTGISILVGGFLSLNGELSAIHWQIITYLAWFSSVTHLTGLTILRRYLQLHRREKYVRVALMLTQLLILIVAMIPTIFFNWQSPRSLPWGPRATAATPKSPTACLFSLPCGRQIYKESMDVLCSNDHDGIYTCPPLEHTPALQEMVLGATFLIFGFLSKSLKLSTRLSYRFYKHAMLPVRNFVHNSFSALEHKMVAPNPQYVGTDHYRFLSLKHTMWRHFIIRPLLAVIITMNTHVDMINSILGEVSYIHTTFSLLNSLLFNEAYLD